jgi:hypothetical protein
MVYGVQADLPFTWRPRARRLTSCAAAPPLLRRRSRAKLNPRL